MPRSARSTGVRRLTSGAVAGIVFSVLMAGCSPVGAEPPAESTSTEPVPTAIGVESATPSETLPAETTDHRSSVTVIVTGVDVVGSGEIEVMSFVTGYIGEGTCTVSATSADGTVTRDQRDALPDAQTTVCPTTSLLRLAAGTYDVTVEFSNASHHGVSDPTSVEVPA